MCTVCERKWQTDLGVCFVFPLLLFSAGIQAAHHHILILLSIKKTRASTCTRLGENGVAPSLPSPSSSFTEQGWNMRPEYNQTNDYGAFYLFIHHFTLIYSCLSIYQLEKKKFPWIVLLKKFCTLTCSVKNFQGQGRKRDY